MDIRGLRNYAKLVEEKLRPEEEKTIYEFRVAGVTFEGRQYIVNKMDKDTPVRLYRQLDNEHDSWAVAIEAFVFDTWLVIGYVPEHLNKALIKKTQLDDGVPVREIRVKSVSGLDNVGVTVSMEKE